MNFQTKYQISEYINKPIYYLTPIGISENNAKDGSIQWVFRCVCGKEIETTPYRVISGHNKSCGCMRYKNIVHKEHSRENSTKTNPEEYIGQKNNKLTVIGYEKPKEKGRLKLKCQCDCGNITYVYPYQFTNGKVKSCGCSRTGNTTNHSIKNGLSRTREYHIWQGIKQRCYNPNADNYPRYGGRGIKMCNEWLNDVSSFIEWLNSLGGLQDGLSIDRINVNGDYSPDNCRLATLKEQSRNMRTNKMLTFNGRTHCIAEWAEILGMEAKLISNRLSKGWSIEKALTTPVQSKYSHNQK